MIKVIEVANFANLEERQLLLLIQQKDKAAIGFLYDKYAPLIYGIILRQVKNEKIATTILQAAFVTIIKECDTLDCLKQSLFTWILKLTHKSALNDFRVELNLRSLITLGDSSESFVVKKGEATQKQMRSTLYGVTSN